MRLLEKLLDLIFPPFPVCAVCGHDADLPGICSVCRNKMTDQSPYTACRICGRYTETRGGSSAVCHECARSAPTFFVARSLGPYRAELKEAIYLFKYRGYRELAVPFGQMLAGLIMDQPCFAGAGMLVPVPLGSRKALERGFNQSELLAETAGRILGLPVNRCLSRVRETPSQSKLTGHARRDMVHGIFALNAGCGGNVILIDDILTTGATAGECSRLLRSGGADRVGVVTLAAGIQEKSGQSC